MALTVKHEAFLDLEDSLFSSLNSAWARYWNPVGHQIQEAVDAKNWSKAHDLIQKIDLTPVVSKAMKKAETIGFAAVLLGASRLKEPKKSLMYKSPPRQQVGNAVKQLKTALIRNAALALKLQAHKLVRQEEQKHLEAQLVYKAESGMRVLLSNQAQGFLSITSSLHTSRLSSFGFLAEAMDEGLQSYKVDEVMDLKTCEICRGMHGRVFPVEAGMRQAVSIMETPDPDMMKYLAPWPKAKNVKQQSSSQLVANNLSLPPYHPGCRGIVVQANQAISLSPQSDRIALAMGALFGAGVTADVLGSRLYGNMSDLEPDEYDENDPMGFPLMEDLFAPRP